jgi:hypothetical protein
MSLKFWDDAASFIHSPVLTKKKEEKYCRNLNEIGMSTRAIHKIFKKLNKSSEKQQQPYYVK